MANEKRLIDANALIEKMENTSSDVCADYGDGFCQHGYSTQLFRLMVSESPTVDAVEVVHGRWESHTNASVECSVCDGVVLMRFKFCPHCGAKMDGERREGE